MVRVTIDTTDITKLTEAMKRYGGIMPTTKANQALRKSARPMLLMARAEVPVWQGERERVSLATGRAAIKRGSNPNNYRKGGATKRDLRLKAVAPKRDEIARVLVGVSKRSGKVGWRTHFIEQGTKPRYTKNGRRYRGSIRANPFLNRSYTQTIDMVRTDFGAAYREAFIKWAKATWPQITR
jgi:HK97 gp10 family phage protein